jgi:glutamate dehydrogenase
MQQQIEQLPADSFWHSLAKIALSDDVSDLQRSIAQQAMAHQDGGAGEVLDRWEHGNRQALERAQRLLQELRDTGTGDLAMLSVALRELRNLV